MFTADQYVMILKHFNRLYKKDKNQLELNYDKVLDCIKIRDLSSISSFEAGLAFRFDEVGYQEIVLEFLQQYFGGFCQMNHNGNIVVQHGDKNSWPNHQEIYKLLFINFSNEEFMNKVQKVVHDNYKSKMVPVIQESFDSLIYKDPDLSSLIVTITNKKHDQTRQSVGEEDMIVNDNEKVKDLQGIYCEAIINKHNAFNKIVKIQLNKLQEIVKDTFRQDLINEGIDKSKIKERLPIFLIGPIKEAQRTIEKFGEQAKELGRTQPWFMLRDLTRCSFIINNCRDTIRLYQIIKEFCESNMNIEIVEVKNMFNNQMNEKDELKYSQKDCKIILKQENEGFPLFIELQLILTSMIELKKSMHKFQDITRSSFYSLSFDQYKELMTIGLDSIYFPEGYKYDKDDISNQFEYLIEQCREIGKTAQSLKDNTPPTKKINPQEIWTQEGLDQCYCLQGSTYKGFWNDTSRMPSIFMTNENVFNQSFQIGGDKQKNHSINGHTFKISGLNTSITISGSKKQVRQAFVLNDRTQLVTNELIVSNTNTNVEIKYQYVFMNSKGSFDRKLKIEKGWNSYQIQRLDFTIQQ